MMQNMAETTRMEKLPCDLLKRRSPVLESGGVRRGTEKGRLYTETTSLGFPHQQRAEKQGGSWQATLG